MGCKKGLAGCGFQLFDGFAHERIEAGAPGIEMRENGFAHPRIPKFPDVLGGAGYGLVGALTGEEFADLVRHIDELRIMRHWSRRLAYCL